MFGINEVLSGKIKISELTLNQKLDILKTDTPPEILLYLKNIFKNLEIEVYTNPADNIMNLASKNLLRGWCWETTNSAAVFLKDTDYIERGNILLENNYPLFHSWLCFEYNNLLYVFDPCLNFLARKDIFNNLFKPNVEGIAKSYDVKHFLLNALSKKEATIDEEKLKTQKLLESIIEKSLKTPKNKVTIFGEENINSPMFRGIVGYTIEGTNNQIRKLVAHIYDPRF